ncbi:MAG: SMP-30/gluconolactonase/LRE family protein [Limnobacter sp.]|uniref:SMP-30/gluconolactonase/LRE family protein n=1 Tax=Limnobacter sp. TaxID=2003368 RepID=UPI00391DF710
MSLWRKIIVPVVLLPVVVIGGLALCSKNNIQSVAWAPAPAPSLDTGPYQRNDALAAITVHGRANLPQPESLALGPDGKLYTGLANGDIVRFSPSQLAMPGQADAVPLEMVVNTGGRPLGMTFHPEGFLVVADGQRGLLKVDVAGLSTPSTSVKVLASQFEGQTMRFVDDVAVTPDGQAAYFSDASTKYGMDAVVIDLLEHGGHGRLYRYDFATHQVSLVKDALNFVNGVTLSKAGDAVVFTETGSYWVHRHWIAGPKAGQTEVLIDNLPGFPDNIRTDAQGLHWVALPSSRDKLVDLLAPYPTIRNLVGHLLEVVSFPVNRTAMAVAVDDQGQVRANLQALKADQYHYITQVTPVGDQLFFSSVTVAGVARMARPDIR